MIIRKRRDNSYINFPKLYYNGVMEKFLAIDFGLKRIGLAEADSESMIAFTLQALEYKSYEKALGSLVKKIIDDGYTKVLIGLPLGYENKETQMSIKIREFSEDLKKEIPENISISFLNEVLTSELAKSNLKRSGKKDSIDSESARIILQEYLDNILLKITDER